MKGRGGGDREKKNQRERYPEVQREERVEEGDSIK